MSIWTHVNASFRLDSFGIIPDKEIIKIFGKTLDYNELRYFNHNYDEYLPMGSEGTLKMSIWHNTEEGSIASTTVSVFGDLRDYDDFDDIEKWFNECCDKCSDILGIVGIRQAICQVEIESCGQKIFSKGW